MDRNTLKRANQGSIEGSALARLRRELTVIQAALDLVALDIESRSRPAPYLVEALSACERAAKLLDES